MPAVIPEAIPQLLPPLLPLPSPLAPPLAALPDASGAAAGPLRSVVGPQMLGMVGNLLGALGILVLGLSLIHI